MSWLVPISSELKKRFSNSHNYYQCIHYSLLALLFYTCNITYSLQCASCTSHPVGYNTAGLIIPIFQIKKVRLCIHITYSCHLVGKQLTSNPEIFLLPITVPRYQGWFCTDAVWWINPLPDSVSRQHRVDWWKGTKSMSGLCNLLSITSDKSLNVCFLIYEMRDLHHPSRFLTWLCLRSTSRDFCEI